MSLLDRLRIDRAAGSAVGAPRAGTAGRRLASRLEAAGDHAIRSHEPEGWLGSALVGAWTALLSLLAVALPVLLVWATSSTPTGWGQAARLTTQAWLVVHGVGLQVPGGQLHLLPLGLTALPLWLCWRAGRRVGACAPTLHDRGARGVLRSLGLPVAGLAGGYALVLVGAALLAHGAGVRPVWWHAVVAGVAVPLAAGGAAAVRSALLTGRVELDGSGVLGVVAGWLRVPTMLRRAAGPAVTGVGLLLGAAVALLVAAVLVQHLRVLTVHEALAPGVVGGVVLVLGQLAVAPNLVAWVVSWCAGPGFAVGVGTGVTPTASTLGALPLVPVLGALPSPGPMPAVAQAVVLLPVVVGAVIGWRCARQTAGPRGEPAAGVLSTILVALVAAAIAAVALTCLALLSGGSAGPGRLSDVGPSAWRVGVALLLELALGAAASAWLLARRA